MFLRDRKNKDDESGTRGQSGSLSSRSKIAGNNYQNETENRTENQLASNSYTANSKDARIGDNYRDNHGFDGSNYPNHAGDARMTIAERDNHGFDCSNYRNYTRDARMTIADRDVHGFDGSNYPNHARDARITAERNNYGFDGSNYPTHTIDVRTTIAECNNHDFDGSNYPNHARDARKMTAHCHDNHGFDGSNYPNHTRNEQMRKNSSFCIDGSNYPYYMRDARMRSNENGYNKPVRPNSTQQVNAKRNENRKSSNRYSDGRNENSTYLEVPGVINNGMVQPSEANNLMTRMLVPMQSSMHVPRECGPRYEQPRPVLPTYNGRGKWESFIIPFTIMADRFDWGKRRQVEEVLLSLRDEALSFVAQLPREVRENMDLLGLEMEKRFGDHTLPETYRRNLQKMKKQYDETYQKFSARIAENVRKAYPGIGSELYNSLCVEHMLSGIHDQDVAYDVLTKRPKTVDEAINLITWHRSCKRGLRSRKANKHSDDEDEDENTEIRRVNQKSYVTEERLQQFGRDLRENLVKEITESIKRTIVETCHRINKEERENWKRYKQNLTCFVCQEEGHIAKNCPLRRQENRQNAMIDRQGRELQKEKLKETVNQGN
ncbi:hypothetical protein FSP39_001356 [Pinctada imbricata]|uniref:CCHC-type domain-containing protein n=1 Tax=Pinctada imbricata TaxID=66713 RepID=A0AA88YAC9_PINIB|nr:hypothetical protein FSP39_001356 [Pinctada imbricata]